MGGALPIYSVWVYTVIEPQGKFSCESHMSPQTAFWVLLLFFFNLYFFLFLCMNVLPECICSPCVCSVPVRSKDDIRSLGPGVTSGCEPLRGCWELDLDPLQEQPVSLTTGSLLQPRGLVCNYMVIALTWRVRCDPGTHPHPHCVLSDQVVRVHTTRRPSVHTR